MNPLQRAAVRRKALYFAAILGLFTLSMFWRGTLELGAQNRVPPTAAHAAADWLGARSIASRATALELRELDTGDPEVSGEALRLSLTGSKGFVTAYLWRTAIEKQKRGDLAELEQLVQIVTKLQPHFITPWLFQSWNIAYNVSVDQHRLGDMYFYIARGIELLAEGERRNKRSPDMPYQLATYYQNKFGVASDKVQTLRCLFQLSCIPPAQRKPVLFATGSGAFNSDEFKKFCEENPHLVRRLRDRLNCTRPEDVVQFLEENRGVPSRFKNDSQYAADDKQFPVLPPPFKEGPDEWNPSQPASDDTSAYRAIRAWFAYSLVQIPPNPVWDDEQPIPAPAPRPGPRGTAQWDEYDSAKYRMPKMPMLIIYRQGAPRAQTYQADLESKEGWFDDAGWNPNDGVDEAAQWFPRRDASFGRARAWSLEAWRESYKRWQAHGERNALIVDPGRLQAMREAAGTDAATYPQKPPPEELAKPGAARRYEAQVGLYFFQQNRSVTNFPNFLTSAETEMQPATVQARKVLYAAEEARGTGDTARAIRLYEDGLAKWRGVLADHPEFHAVDAVQEEAHETELKLIQLLVQDDPRVRAKAGAQYEAAFRALVPAAGAVPPARNSSQQEAARREIAELEFSPFGRPMSNGEPWIKPWVKEMVKTRLGSTAPAAPPGPAPTAAR